MSSTGTPRADANNNKDITDPGFRPAGNLAPPPPTTTPPPIPKTNTPKNTLNDRKTTPKATNTKPNPPQIAELHDPRRRRRNAPHTHQKNPEDSHRRQTPHAGPGREYPTRTRTRGPLLHREPRPPPHPTVGPPSMCEYQQ